MYNYVPENKIDQVDRGILVGFFNDGGYVLDFSTAEFDRFTAESVGVPLCSVYQLSKGKSLKEFTHKGEPAKVVKLYGDLVRYYEGKFVSDIDTKPAIRRQLQNIKVVISKYAENDVTAVTPLIQNVNREYIREKTYQANEDVEEGRLDSALTKARTLLEETFCYALELRGEHKDRKEDIYSLYKRVKVLYKMCPNHSYDNRVNDLLNGLEKILKSLTEMRNLASDSHGLGSARITIEKRHARLFVNAALTMAEFVLSVAEARH